MSLRGAISAAAEEAAMPLRFEIKQEESRKRKKSNKERKRQRKSKRSLQQKQFKPKAEVSETHIVRVFSSVSA